MGFAPHTDADIRRMLEVIGASSVNDLFRVIPEDIRLERRLDIPDGRSEPEVLRELAGLAARNRSADDLVCFLGGGAYDHHVPSVVWALLSRGELMTSYTPYQPELSQGVLQALFEYQTMICELTGLDVSNAGLYDGASALSEAVNLVTSFTGRGSYVVAGAVNPNYTAVLETQAAGLALERREAAWSPQGVVDLEALRSVLPDAGAVVVQQPNFFGCIEDVPAIAELAHAAGTRVIVHADLTSLGVLEAPGAQGADVVVAEGQPFGNHLNFGGPYAGVIACRMDEVRRLPGRLVGETVDRSGKQAFVLTLQAREQHIRREKATSNICTNQTLNTLAVAVALAWYGPEGLRELGERCLAKARYARDRLCEIPGVQLLFDAPFFKEFAVALPTDARTVCSKVAADGFLAGLPLADTFSGETARTQLEHGLLVAVTEKRTREEIDGLVDAVARACKEAS